MSTQKTFLSISLSGISLLSLVPYFDDTEYWITDIASQFPFQYALAAFVLFVVCLYKKQIAFGVLAGLLTVFNLNTVIDIEKPIHAAGYVNDTFKVFSANIHKDNMELSALKHEVQKIDPAILLLLEVTPKQKDQLYPIILTYPYHVENIFEGDLGFIFLSKFPVHQHHISKLSKYGNSLLEARLEIKHRPVMFYGIHAQRPDRGDHSERKRQFFEPAKKIREHTLPAIVAGDFNTTPYSPVFRKFLNIAGLKDSREGFGWQPSWPTFFPPLWIPIDHVLVTHNIQVHKRTTGSYIGSDHYPVIAELLIN